jgi:periplasmic protein TonB
MSDLGNLSQCMVDSDAAANGRARRLRGKALMASLALELAVVAAVLLWPLATLGVLPPQLTLMPVPPYRGEQRVHPAQRDHGARTISRTPHFATHQLYQPPTIPSHIAVGADSEPPGVELSGDPYGSGDPMIPGGTGTGSIVEIARPAPPEKPRKLSMGVMDASLIRRIQPDYPRIATLIHLSGTVLLRATIGTDGEVRDVEVVSGSPILAEAAVKAVRQWRYRPTLLSGEPVEVETQITVTFVLQ